MENPILQQQIYMEQLAKVRQERIRELKVQIKSRRDMAHGYLDASVLPDTLNRGGLWEKATKLNDEADDLQRRLDILLGQPLGDTPKNGEPRSIDSQSNW